MIVAHTIKGKGVSFMEGQLAWHYKSPSDEQLAAALAELGGGSVRNAFVATLQELAADDPRILLVTGDLGFNLFEGFRREPPRPVPQRRGGPNRT